MKNRSTRPGLIWHLLLKIHACAEFEVFMASTSDGSAVSVKNKYDYQMRNTVYVHTIQIYVSVLKVSRDTIDLKVKDQILLPNVEYRDTP